MTRAPPPAGNGGAEVVASGCWDHVAKWLPPRLQALLPPWGTGARRLSRWLAPSAQATPSVRAPRLCCLDMFEVYLDNNDLRRLARHLPPTARVLRVRNNLAPFHAEAAVPPVQRLEQQRVVRRLVERHLERLARQHARRQHASPPRVP